MSKFLVLIIFVLCFVLVFSQENKPLRYSKYFSFGVESKISKNTLDEHFKDYMEKCKKLGLDEYQSEFRAYHNRININKIEEFKSIGFDLIGFFNSIHLRENPYKLDELSLFCPVIITGTVIKINELTGRFRREIIIKADSYLKGEYFFETPPEIYKFYTYSGYVYEEGKKVYQPNTIAGQPLKGIINKGNKLVYYLGKENYEMLSEKRKQGYPSDCKDINVNIEGESGYFIISQNNHLIEDIYYDDLEFFNKDIGDTLFSKENIDYYEKKIRKFEEINDTPAFYNRSYK